MQPHLSPPATSASVDRLLGVEQMGMGGVELLLMPPGPIDMADISVAELMCNSSAWVCTGGARNISFQFYPGGFAINKLAVISAFKDWLQTLLA